MVTPAKEPVPNEDRIVDLYRRVAESSRFRSSCRITPPRPTSTCRPTYPAGGSHVPSIACVKEEAVPTARKIRQVREGLASGSSRLCPVSAGFTRLSIGKRVLTASIPGSPFRKSSRRLSGGSSRRLAPGPSRFIHDLRRSSSSSSSRAWPRKELFRRRGLIMSARARRPGTAVSPTQATQLDALLARTLPGADITRPIATEASSANEP